jgi:hypothetical protein
VKRYILLCRPRFEVALVELDDKSDRRARRRSLEQAASAAWTLLPFDSLNYQPHIKRHLSETDVEMAVDAGATRAAALAKVLALEQDEDTRYLLVKAANIDEEAELLHQPWSLDLPPMGRYLPEAFEADRKKCA